MPYTAELMFAYPFAEPAKQGSETIKIRHSTQAVAAIMDKPSILLKMKNKRIAIYFATVISMTLCGLIYSAFFGGVSCLTSRPDPEPDPWAHHQKRIYQVWKAKQSIKKGQPISLDDFVVDEVKTYDLSKEYVTVWISRVKWTAAKDMVKGQTLKEACMQPKSQKELDEYLRHAVVLNPGENTRAQYISWYQGLEKILKPVQQ